MQTRSREGRPKVPGRFVFPGARNPRVCSISRFGKIFLSSCVLGVFARGFSRKCLHWRGSLWKKFIVRFAGANHLRTQKDTKQSSAQRFLNDPFPKTPFFSCWFSSNFPGTSLEFSSGTPGQIPETDGVLILEFSDSRISGTSRCIPRLFELRFSALRPSRVKFAWHFPFSTPFLTWNFGEIFRRTPKPWKT